MKLGNKLRHLLWATPRVLKVVRWQGDEIANEIDVLEAELARLRALAEAATNAMPYIDQLSPACERWLRRRRMQCPTLIS